MDIQTHRVKNLSYVVIDNYFSNKELQAVLEELHDLRRLAAGPDICISAKSEDGVRKKTGLGFFIDDVYIDRAKSPLLVATRKIFSREVLEPIINFDTIFGFIRQSNRDNCLVNYYTVGQTYESHHDYARISAVTLLGIGKFVGGGFAFPDQGVEIEFKQSRTIIFPSCVNHASMPLEGGPDACRVSIAQFIDNKQ